MYIAAARMMLDTIFLFIGARTSIVNLNRFEMAWVSLTFVLLMAAIFVWNSIRLKQGTGKTCPSCGYNLTGLPSLVCPECGVNWLARSKQQGKGRRYRRRLAIYSGTVFFAVTLGFGLQLHYFCDTGRFCLIVSDPAKPILWSGESNFLDKLEYGMSQQEVEDLIGSPTGWQGTCADSQCSTYSEKTLYYGFAPDQYLISILPPITPILHHEDWRYGPILTFDEHGRLQAIERQP